MHNEDRLIRNETITHRIAVPATPPTFTILQNYDLNHRWVDEL